MTLVEVRAAVIGDMAVDADGSVSWWITWLYGSVEMEVVAGSGAAAGESVESAGMSVHECSGVCSTIIA